MSGYGPFMVVPQAFTHLPDSTISLRKQQEVNSDFHTLKDPLGKPHGVLDTGFHDFQSGEIERRWEEQNGNQI